MTQNTEQAISPSYPENTTQESPAQKSTPQESAAAPKTRRVWQAMAQSTLLRRIGPPLLVFLVALIPRALSLNTFITYDEYDQIGFAARFLMAMLDQDWAGALVLGYPGVPTMALGALGLWIQFQAINLGWLPEPSQVYIPLAEQMLIDPRTIVSPSPLTLEAMLWHAPQYPLAHLTAVRLPLVIVTSLTVLAIYLLLKRLVDHRLAFFGAVVLSFNPLFLALSRIIHVDAPLSYFAFASFLAFVLYLQRGQWLVLGLSGLFGALAVLSKTPAILLGPILVVTGLAHVAFPPEASNRREQWRRFLWAMLGWGGIAVVAFFALWPSMWSRPWFAVTWIFRNILENNQQTRSGSGIFWGYLNSDRNPFYYTYAFPFRWTPFTTLGILASFGVLGRGLWAYFQQKSGFARQNLALLLSLYGFVLIFVGAISFISRRSVRYTLPAMFPLEIIAVLGWAGLLMALLALLSRWWSKEKQAQALTWLLGSLIFLQAINVFQIHPYYYAYFNPTLGGGQTAPQWVNMGLGEGLDSAARYINQQENAAELTTATWFIRQFAPFFKGQSTELFEVSDVLQADYSVFYITQLQLGFPTPELLDYFAHREPEKIITLGDVDYAWIYPGPIVGDSVPEMRYPLNVVFDDTVTLAGLDLSDKLVSADEGNVPLTLYWETLKTIPGDFNVSIRLVDEAGRSWGHVDRLPLGGLMRMPTWQAGQVMRDDYRLNFDPGTPPGTYTFDIILYDFETGDIFDQVRRVGAVNITPASQPIDPATLEDFIPSRRNQALAADLTLIGHNFQASILTPGKQQSLKLHWYAERQPSTDHNLRLLAQAEDGTDITLLETPLGPASYPSSQWPRETVLGQAYTFYFPVDASAGQYTLYAQIAGQDSRAELGEVVIQDLPRVRDLPNAAEIERTQAYFGAQIGLVGYEITENETEGQLELTLYWQASRTPSEDYKVFVHLSQLDENIVSQRDSVPDNGARPTTGWLPGEFIIDRYNLQAPPGEYRLWVGMYDPLTQSRLPISGPVESSAERLLLTEIVVD